jgi:hypothetical protein
MNQVTNNPAIIKKDINSIFKNKPKPISYVKGDLAYLAEISEDSLIIPKNSAGNSINPVNEIGVNKTGELKVSKKGLSEDKIQMERQIKIGKTKLILQ